MPPKKINKPKTKHANFPTMQFRLAGDDWLIAIWNPHNRQACYFLAEPSEYGVGKASGKKEPLGYFVTSLERAGIARSVFPSLPRLFKNTDKAAEWLEDQVESYTGDEFVPSIPLHGESAGKQLNGVSDSPVSAVMGERLDKTAPVKASRRSQALREEVDGEIITEAHSLAADIEMKMRAL